MFYLLLGLRFLHLNLLRWVTCKLCTSKWLSSEIFFDFLQSCFYISWPNWVFFLFKLSAQNFFLLGFQACWTNCYLCGVILSDKQTGTHVAAEPIWRANCCMSICFFLPQQKSIFNSSFSFHPCHLFICGEIKAVSFLTW